MKKTIIICLSLALCLSMSACGKKTVKNDVQAPTGGLEVKENNTLSGWLKKGKAVECEVLSPEGRVAIKSKNNAVRMEGIPFYSADSAGSQSEAANGVLLTANGWTYTWDMETKKGTKINNAELAATGTGEESEEADANKDWNAMVKEWDDAQTGYDCREASLDDELFTEPADIEFTDLTAMLNGASDFATGTLEDMEVPEIPGSPTLDGLDIPEGANQEDIEEILEDLNPEVNNTL